LESVVDCIGIQQNVLAAGALHVAWMALVSEPAAVQSPVHSE